MTKDEVVSMAGEPTRTASIKSVGVDSEAWDYLAADGTYYRFIFDNQSGELGLKLSGQQ
jgi:hypothetical protein